MGVVQPGYRSHQRHLHVEGQTRGNPVGIQFVGIESFGLDEDLMRVLVRKAVNLVLYRWTITGTHALDATTVHRRAIYSATDDLVSDFAGAGDEATDLPWMVLRRTQEGHHRHRLVAGLLLHDTEIDTPGVDSGRCSSLQAADPQRQLTQSLRQRIGGRIARATSGIVLQTDVNQAPQKGSGRQHHGGAKENQPHLRNHPRDLITRHDEIIHRLLKDNEIGLILDHAPYRGLVKDAVGLGTGRPDRGTLSLVEDSELDACTIGSQSHGATQGIDFLDQMALADATDCRVAGHLTKGFYVVGQQQRLAAHACRRESGFGTCMAAANDNDVERIGILHGVARYCFCEECLV